MSVVPAFEIGVWNAWILLVFFLAPFVPIKLINKEAANKVNEGWASQQWSTTDRRLALSTHVIIGPLTIIYSVFVPLKPATVWFYAALPVFFERRLWLLWLALISPKPDLMTNRLPGGSTASRGIPRT